MNLKTRILSLRGTCNTRDLGGLTGRDRRTVRAGRIIRSDELNGLNETDLGYFSDLGLCTIVDLRIREEFEKRPDRIPSTVRNHITRSMNTPAWMSAIVEEMFGDREMEPEEESRNLLGCTDAKVARLDSEQIRSAVGKLYEKFVVDPACLDAYRTVFELLSREDGPPLLFHCVAGKDRTGIVAALILSALGVPQEKILEDYLLSNCVVEKKYSKQIRFRPNLRTLYESRPEYLQSALKKIRDEYGSMDDYLRNVLNVDPETLQRRFLEP